MLESIAHLNYHDQSVWQIHVGVSLLAESCGCRPFQSKRPPKGAVTMRTRKQPPVGWVSSGSDFVQLVDGLNLGGLQRRGWDVVQNWLGRNLS